MSELSELYQQVILDHNKKPRNFRRLADATQTADGYNPLCGDQLTVDLRVADDRIEEATFEGSGCAISKASASMMTQAVKGKSREEAERLFGEFHRMVTGELDEEREENSLGRLKIFAGVREYPARVKCASLPWHTLHAALAGDGAATTEDIGPDITADQVSA
jgi:nitrogen fixation protein NifU and related proteins